MSGHSKWSTIKRKKGKEDAKRGQIFSKLSKAITVAAREGGGNVDANVSLANAIEKAKQYNMPADNIERAVKKGSGDAEGVTYEQFVYEGYAPAGVALMVEVMTDNRNRAASDIRHIFTKYNGNLGTTGSVAWLFEHKGIVLVPKKSSPMEDELLDLVLEAGADDLKEEDDHFEIVCQPQNLKSVTEALKSAGVEIASSETTMLPKNTVNIDKAAAKKVLKIVEALEDNDDVQEVYANFDIPDAVMEEIAAEG
jgi:YebC/PmpR family DNA-binding regulatory protein